MKPERQPWPGIALRKPVSLPPVPAAKIDFVQSAMIGRMTPEDMAYMARALLSLSDENAELKERVRALEMVVKALVARDGETR